MINVLDGTGGYDGKVSPRYLQRVVNRIVKYFTDNPADSRPYKVYAALLSQSGLDSAPTAEVLENTLGDISFGYTDIGRYVITLDSAEFVNLKTSISINYVNTTGDGEFRSFVICGREDAQTLRLRTYDASLTLGNSLLSSHFIEIRVYN